MRSPNSPNERAVLADSERRGDGDGLDPVADRQHAALSTLTRAAIERRGHLDAQDVSAFVDAGFRRDQVLEVVAVAAASTITNYVGNITQPPLEAQFQAHVWHA